MILSRHIGSDGCRLCFPISSILLWVCRVLGIRPEAYLSSSRIVRREFGTSNRNHRLDIAVGNVVITSAAPFRKFLRFSTASWRDGIVWPTIRHRTRLIFFLHLNGIFHIDLSQSKFSNVMLKSILCLDTGLPCRLSLCQQGFLNLQVLKACISTNSAINKSLRRSQHGDHKQGRFLRQRRGEDVGNLPGSSPSRGRLHRPNQQRGLDIEDMEKNANVRGRYQTLRNSPITQRASRRLKPFAHESVDAGLSTGETADRPPSQYDYSSHPEGNRDTRRAAKFGRVLKPPSNGQTIGTNRRAVRRQAMREHEALNSRGLPTSGNLSLEGGVENSGELSMPRDLYSDSEIPSSFSDRRFTMDRRTTSPNERFSGDRGSDRGFGKSISVRDDLREGKPESDAPLSLPYTTPASEFLYGTSVVVAALLSSRRKLYKLYIYEGDNREAKEQDLRIRKLALERNVVIERVKGDWLRTMDRMSTGRPHNVRFGFSYGLEKLSY